MLRDPAVSYLTGSALTSLCIDSPVITIAPIGDPQACDTVMLTLEITISRARGSPIGAIVTTGESIHRDVNSLPV